MLGSRCGGIVLTLAASLSLAPPAHAQRHPRGRPHDHPPVDTSGTPTTGSPPTTGGTTTAATAPIPLAPNELIGDRIARARLEMERLEFDHALALLTPLHGRADIPPSLGIQAALLETVALIAQQRAAEAVTACQRGVVLAGYDPDVAHDQAPRVRAACLTAAEQARHDLVGTRALGIATTTLTTAPVAWNPVAIQVQFRGDLTGLSTLASVRVPNGDVIQVNLPNASGSVRSATLDANLASPGGRIEVTPIVRDRFGTLLQAEQPSSIVVPTAAAAVRFALGSDEGPLRIDGQAIGRLRIGGLVPLEPGPHTLEVRAASGVTTTAQTTLHRGEVALLTLHGVPGNTALDVAKWTATGGAVLLLASAGLFQFLASQSAAQLTSYSRDVDSQTNLPLIPYDNVVQIDRNLTLFENLALGLVIGSGSLAVLATIFWAIPHGGHDAHTAHPDRARLDVAPGGFTLRF